MLQHFHYKPTTNTSCNEKLLKAINIFKTKYFVIHYLSAHNTRCQALKWPSMTVSVHANDHLDVYGDSPALFLALTGSSMQTWTNCISQHLC